MTGTVELARWLRQCGAVLRKNLQLKSLNKREVLVEVLSSLLLLLLLVWGFSQSETRHYDARDYTTAPELLNTTLVVDTLVASTAVLLPDGTEVPLDTLMRLMNVGSGGSGSSTAGTAAALLPNTATTVTSLGAALSAAALLAANGSATPADVFSSGVTNDVADGAATAAALAALNWSDVVALGGGVNVHQGLNATQVCVPDGVCMRVSTGGLDLLSGLFDTTQLLTMLDGPLPMPPFDAFVGLARLVQSSAGTNNISDTQLAYVQGLLGGRLGNLLTLGELTFAAEDAATLVEVEALVEFWNRSSVFFRDHYRGPVRLGLRDAADAVVQRAARGERQWAHLAFRALSRAHEAPLLDFDVRMNYSSLPTTRQNVKAFARGLDQTYQGYFTSGFLSLMVGVSDFVAARGGEGQNQAADFGTMLSAGSIPSIVPFPTAEYDTNLFYSAVAQIFGLVLTVSTTYPASRLVKHIVEEKQSRMQETLGMMGLSSSARATADALTYFFIFLLLSGLMTHMLHTSFAPHSDRFLIFLYFFLFFVSEIALCFLLSAFFSKAKVAVVAAPLIIIVAVMPRYVFFSTTEEESIDAKRASCLLSPTAFAFGADTLMTLEDAGVGLQWSNYGAGDFSFADVLRLLFGDTLLYALLAWYCNNVVPSEYGLRRHPFFFLSGVYWRSVLGLAAKERKETAQLLGSAEAAAPIGSEDVEQAPAGLEPVLLLRGLRKTFGRNVAVRGLELDAYDSSIFCLLGHNGAGKTTTISMLTGLIPPTSGDATVFGHSISEDMGSIRRLLGVCPQHDVLFPQLTVRQHLELFAALKGVPAADVAAEVQTKINLVGLTEKDGTQSRALSGGQRRKLSVAIALLSNSSKAVFLDEPTSGMDPYSRRSTWELLKQSREGRIIVLTTHFMDEADLLADRIAIMSKGQLRCYGSSLFLKGRFGVGYNLTLVRADDSCDTAAVHRLVTQHVPEAGVLSVAGGEMAYELPLEDAPRFPALFAELETRRAQLRIGDYGVGLTTLEEVFLKIAKEEHAGEEEEEEEKEELSEDVGSAPGEDAVAVAVSGDGDGSVEAAAIVPKQLSSWRGGTAGFRTQCMELFRKRAICAWRDRRAFTTTLLLPVVTVALTLLMLELSFAPAGPPLSLRPTSLYQSPVELPVTVANDSLAQPPACLGNVSDDGLLVRYLPMLNGTQAMSRYLGNTHFDHGGTSRFGALITGGPGANNQPCGRATVLHNSSAIHAIPAFALQLMEARARAASGDLGVRYDVRNNPLPLTAREAASQDLILGVIASLFILMPFCYLTANFAVFVVRERQVKSKHLQLVSGVSVQAYWISTWLWDLLQYSFIVAATLVVFVAFDNDNFTKDASTALGVTALFMCHGWAVIPLCYCLTFVFETPASAQTAISTANFLSGFVLLLASYILSALPETASANEALTPLYECFPSFNFGQGIVQISIANVEDELTGNSRDTLDESVAGRFCRLLLIEGAVFFALCLALETRLPQRFVARLLSNARLLVGGRLASGACAGACAEMDHEADEDVSAEVGEEDEDVAAERQRVLALNPAAEGADPLLVRNLRKRYPGRGGTPPKVAVKNVCFGVGVGECFGLLGVNGAGKSTTMAILTGDTQPTRGSASIGACDISTERERVRQLIGYCPQFDPLLGGMTARETLRMFARIKAVPPQQLEDYIEQLLVRVGVRPHADRPCGTYSGGNKRKLSLAIALVGRPLVAFLDEPSTGMDPVARRHMWGVIGDALADTSVVLTSHSMEECEALCHRLGVMVGGRFRCLGSTQHLKSRYGDGYALEIKCLPKDANTIKAFVARTSRGAVLEEVHAGQLKYKLPRAGLTLSSLFAAIEANRALGIRDYSVSQPTLEQVFLSMARQQEEETEVTMALRLPEEEVTTPEAQVPEANGDTPLTTRSAGKGSRNGARPVHSDGDVEMGELQKSLTLSGQSVV